jgi:HAD superfamily hydrolase (TIGR01509 family)
MRYDLAMPANTGPTNTAQTNTAQTNTAQTNTAQTNTAQTPTLALILDLDGTLVDNVYHHVRAWQLALGDMGATVPVWRIHRRIGISAELMARGVLSEGGHPYDPDDLKRLKALHAKRYAALRGSVVPLPGARELLAHLEAQHVPWVIASSSPPGDAEPMLEVLGLSPATPLITGSDVARAKPHPDLFLAAAERLGVDPSETVVVGDSIWDLLAAQRAGALAVGLLSGGYGRDELDRARAYRVYDDPAELLTHIEEIGVPNADGVAGPST